MNISQTRQILAGKIWDAEDAHAAYRALWDIRIFDPLTRILTIHRHI